MIIEGKVAVVAGGGSGLGAATVAALREAGATVVVLDLKSPAAESDGVHFQAADVRDPDGVAAALAYAAELGEVRIGVCCAGIVEAAKTLTKDGPHDLEAFKRVVDVNLVGTFNFLRLATAQIAEYELDGEERGILVATASIAAFEGQIGQAAYAASKGGVVGMTLPIARDLATLAIRCVAIAPGLFETPMLAELPGEARRKLAAGVPHPQRLGRPQEYGALVRSVVENPMINGDTLRIDGALRMAPR